MSGLPSRVSGRARRPSRVRRDGRSVQHRPVQVISRVLAQRSTGCDAVIRQTHADAHAVQQSKRSAVEQWATSRSAGSPGRLHPVHDSRDRQNSLSRRARSRGGSPGYRNKAGSPGERAADQPPGHAATCPAPSVRLANPPDARIRAASSAGIRAGRSTSSAAPRRRCCRRADRAPSRSGRRG